MQYLLNRALCFKGSGTRFYVTPPSLNGEIKFDIEKNTATYTTTKNKSTVGRAIVGGALAGGVGAVVVQQAHYREMEKRQYQGHIIQVITT